LRRRLSESGFTIFECAVAVGLAGMVSLWASSIMKKPAQSVRYLHATDSQLALGRAAEFLVNDIREADPSSISWQLIPPEGTAVNEFSFWKMDYDLQNPGSSVKTNLRYRFEPDPAASDGRGFLIREVNGNAAVILSNFPAPTVTVPLLQSDPSVYHVLEMTLRQHTGSGQVLQLTRRMAVKG
jgi:hypothetical protein